MEVKRYSITGNLFAAMSLFVLLSCGDGGPIAINYGQDNCSYCKMTIVDKSYAAELISEKGKAFKFDSIECLAAFEIAGIVNFGTSQSRWVSDCSKPGELIEFDSATFIHSLAIKSPMGMGLIAVATEKLGERIIDIRESRVVDWNEIKTMVYDKWMNKDSH